MNKLILTLLAVGFIATASAKHDTYTIDDRGCVKVGAEQDAKKSHFDANRKPNRWEISDVDPRQMITFFEW